MITASAELYQALAEILAAHEPPDWLAQPGPGWPLYASVVQLAAASPAARRAVSALASILPEGLAARRERYARLFSGQGRPRIWPYESMVCSGRLLGPETLAVERLYRAAGLEVDSAELPDHISLELAFLAYLVEQDAPSNRLERGFIRRHAGRWMPELGLRLARSGDEVYAPVGALLAGWITERLHPVIHSKKTCSGLPVISQPQDCTLCGFCVQACPKRALKICETRHETALTLLTEACTGCGKCERACDSGAIRLLACAPGQGEGQRLLYSSPRLVCPVCGKATFSRAEFEFVAARIGRPGWLEICPDCRCLALEIET